MKKLLILIAAILMSQHLTAQDSVDVTFYYYPANNPSAVHIPGEFNGWNPSSSASLMIHDALDNSWRKTMRLRVGGPSPLPSGNSIPGAYQYKFHDGNWFADPLNPLQNPNDNNNSYLFINDPTIHLLLPNSTVASGVSRSRHPEISCYLFPSTATSIDTSSIFVTVDGSNYTQVGDGYDLETNRFFFRIPDPLADGTHILSITASNSQGSTISASTSLTVQADLIQFFTLPAQTWKASWRLQGAIFDTDGNVNLDLGSVDIVRDGERWGVSVVDGIIDTSITLMDGENNFQIEALLNGIVETSSFLTIQKKVRTAPTAKVHIIKAGNLLLFTSDGSIDPDGGSLDLAWSENPDNPQALGLTGSTNSQENLAIPGTPGEYFVSLKVTDQDGEADSTQGYFVIDLDGETVDIGNYADNPLWVKNSRIYLLFFKAFTPEGTIAAAIPNLDYIAAMGFNTIWVLPVMEIPGDVDNQINIGYYIEDFSHVESSYGTDQDYKDFVASAHELGLKVIQDVTPNHSGKVHAFAEDAARYGDVSQYWYYYQTEFISHNTNGLGDCTTPEGIYYYCAFSDVLLNWDWRDLDARTYMTGVYEYWMQEFGIDGYRFDVYWGPHRKYGEANMGTPVRNALKHIKPDIMLLGEDDGTGAGTESIYADYGGGLDVSYDFKAYFNAIRSFGFSSSSVNTLHSELDNGGYYPGKNSYYMRFMESQDEDRISYKYNSYEKTMPMASVILTAPGIPMVMNGQEVGWGKGMGAVGEPDLNDRRRGIINWEFGGRNLLTPHYQKLAQIRAQFPAFWQHRQDSNGDGNVNASDESDFDRVPTDNGIVYSFLRPYTNSNGLSVVNFSNAPVTVALNLSAENLKFESGFQLDSTYWVNNLYAGVSEQVAGTDLQNYSVELSAYGSAIFTISNREEMVTIPPLPNLLAIDDEAIVAVDNFKLYQNYPNPFNPVTTIRYELPTRSDVILSIFDINGRLVTTLVSATQASGYHNVEWRGVNAHGIALGTGLYFARIDAGTSSAVIKMIYLK